jgi:hypothetical protein
MFTGLGLDCAVRYGPARMGRARARRRCLCCACARSQHPHPQYQRQPEHCACEHRPTYHAILRRHAAVPGLRSSSDMTNVASGFVLLRCEFRLPVAVCTPFRGLWPVFGPNGRWLGEWQDYRASSRSSLLKAQATPHACWPSTTRRRTQELRLPVLCGPQNSRWDSMYARSNINYGRTPRQSTAVTPQISRMSRTRRVRSEYRPIKLLCICR